MARNEREMAPLQYDTSNEDLSEADLQNLQSEIPIKEVNEEGSSSASQYSRLLPVIPLTQLQGSLTEDRVTQATISIHSTESGDRRPSHEVETVGIPERKQKVELWDMMAASLSLACFIIGVLIVLPKFTLSWRMGLQSQLIAIGMLIGVMNICANKVVTPCFLAIEVKYGKSRLQNLDAILTNKLLASHTQTRWRSILAIFIALPLALSIGYKQFFGGASAAKLRPIAGFYGISYPIVGEWTPVYDTAYLLTSSTAAFHSASRNDTLGLNDSSHYPIPYGYNVLLLAHDSAAVLDLPTNTYLNLIRSKLKSGETWNLSTSVNAYVATQNASAADAVRHDDFAWEEALNASFRGLASYFLNQDAKTWVGMLPNVSQPFCWLGIFEGGPPEEDTYSKSLDQFNAYGFQQSAKLFSLSRQSCHASWNVSASGLRLTAGSCDDLSKTYISQEPVSNPAKGVWMIEGSPSLYSIFVSYATTRRNSTWLMPAYAVTTAAYYWSRGVSVVPLNNITGFNYASSNEQIISTRETLDAAPLLFICLAIQPVLTLLALVVKSAIDLPMNNNFGLVAVLAGVRSSTLGMMYGAGFSGELRRPLKLEVWLTEPEKVEHDDELAAVVKYGLCAERLEVNKIYTTNNGTIYY